MTRFEKSPEYEKLKPDIFILEGSGLIHPDIFETASHFGVMYNVPTLTVSKYPSQLSYERDIRKGLN